MPQFSPSVSGLNDYYTRYNILGKHNFDVKIILCGKKGENQVSCIFIL